MGICWGAPDYPTPSFTGYLKPGQPPLTFSSSSSDDEDGLGKSLGGRVNAPNGSIPPTPNLRVFTLAELKAATRNFRNDTLVGEGGFGRVFKGYLEDTTSSNSSKARTQIAIKKLNPASVQGFKEWKSEVTFLGSLYHPNIVRLLGYCWEKTELLLVYEYMPKGTLKNHLYGRGSTVQLLSWDMRLKIALGSAKGLAYLHQLEKPIICRDFKPSNILLDVTYDAKISDFGLARKGPMGDESHVTTQVLGTYGYAAPEYVITGHLYVNSDVYSFGVVLLEILTGRRAFDNNRPSAEKFLVEWLKPNLSRRKLVRVMDPRLEGKYSLDNALRVAELAFQCLRPEPKHRPSMAEVVKSLEKIAAS